MVGWQYRTMMILSGELHKKLKEPLQGEAIPLEGNRVIPLE
jgi:hypothetical protein